MLGSLVILWGERPPSIYQIYSVVWLPPSSILLYAHKNEQITVTKHINILLVGHTLKDNLLWNLPQVQRRSVSGTILVVPMKKAKKQERFHINVLSKNECLLEFHNCSFLSLQYTQVWIFFFFFVMKNCGTSDSLLSLVSAFVKWNSNTCSVSLVALL